MAIIDDRPRRQSLEVRNRKEWVDEFGKAYRPGMHITFLGPSGRGKTKLAFQMIKAVLRYHPDISVCALHGKIKGRDDTITRAAKDCKLHITPKYPPNAYRRYQIRRGHKRGMILRPLDKPGEGPDEENEILRGQFRKAIHKNYHASKKRPVILLVDEAHQTHEDLKLRRDCEGPLMRGRPVCGEWSLVQRGRYVSYHVYDEAAVVIIFYDPDKNNQQRYSEIGDVDASEIQYYTSQLDTREVGESVISQALVFVRSKRQIFILDF